MQTIKCCLCEKEEHYWKTTILYKGGMVCPKCYYYCLEKEGIECTLEQAKQHKNKEDNHRKEVISYINYVKRLGTTIKDNNIFNKLIRLEENTSIRLFNKDRSMLVGTTDELLLIRSVKSVLEENYKDVKISRSNTLFHKDSTRYYPYV